MNAFERKVALRVVGAHAGVVLLLLATSALRGCFKPKPKEIVTFIEFGAPAAPVSIQQVTQMAEPEPPAPAPEPEPAPIPEPIKKKPVVKPRPKPAPKPKPKEPAKPKWKPVSANDIKIGEKVPEKSSKPAISSADIKKALSGIASSSGASGKPSRFNDYYARVMTLFYNHWTPPATSGSSGSAIVRISMRKNGQITKRAKIKSSGDPLYDKTAMDAVNAVSTLPRPPATFPYDYVEVIFTRDN